MQLSEIKYAGIMNDWLDQSSLQIMRCQLCKHFWYHEQPHFSELMEMYNSSVPLHPERALKISKNKPTPRMLDEMDRLYNYISNSSNIDNTMLDYGSGFGLWTKAATDVGFNVEAYEPSVSRGDQSKNYSGTHVTNNLDELKAESFGLINLEQVLEHVSDPLETLSSLLQYTTKDSILRVSVPNIDRFLLSSNLWKGWPFDGNSTHIMQPFEHLHGFTIKSLKKVLLRSGFQLVPEADLFDMNKKYYLN